MSKKVEEMYKAARELEISEFYDVLKLFGKGVEIDCDDDDEAPIVCAQPHHWDHPADFKFKGINKHGFVVLEEVEYGADDTCCADDIYPQHLQYITDYLKGMYETEHPDQYVNCKECDTECLCHNGFYECQVCGNTGWVGED